MDGGPAAESDRMGGMRTQHGRSRTSLSGYGAGSAKHVIALASARGGDNDTFSTRQQSGSALAPAESWTRPMRPQVAMALVALATTLAAAAFVQGVASGLAG